MSEGRRQWWGRCLILIRIKPASVFIRCDFYILDDFNFGIFCTYKTLGILSVDLIINFNQHEVHHVNFQSIVSLLDADHPNLPSMVKAIAQIAKVAPKIFEEFSRDIVRDFLLSEVGNYIKRPRIERQITNIDLVRP